MSSKRFVYEDLEGLQVGLFPGRINTTCILYRFENTLIDTGPPNQWREVQKFIVEKDVKQICITHHHEDHCGNSAQIKTTTNARMAVNYYIEDGIWSLTDTSSGDDQVKLKLKCPTYNRT